MLRALLVAFIALASIRSPVMAQDFPGAWRSAAGPILISRRIDGFVLSEERALAADGTDTILQFTNPSATGDAATVYVYRASQPNAALWFERALIALAQRPSMTGAATAGERFELATPGASASNALGQSFAVSFGDYRTTGLAIAQVGEWIIKIRISRPSADVGEMDALLRTFVGEIGYSGANAFEVHPLRLPADCGTMDVPDGAPVTANSDNRPAAVVEGLSVYANARGAGGLAANPEQWCEVRLPNLALLANLYRSDEGFDGGWIMLIGDAGWSIVSRRLTNPVENARFALFGNRTSDTTLISLFDGPAELGAALGFAQPVLTGAAQGLARIEIVPRPPSE